MKKVLVLISLLIISHSSFGQWEQLNTPKRKFAAYNLRSFDSALFVSTGWGTFYSLDYGNNWRPLDSHGFNSATVFNEHLYFGWSEGSCYNPNTWENTPQLSKLQKYQGKYYEQEVVSDSFTTPQLLFSDSKYMYATANTSSMDCLPCLGGFYSSQNSTNWSLNSNGLIYDSETYGPPGVHTARFYTFFELTGNSSYIFLGTSRGLFRKAPSGQTWAKSNGSNFPSDAVTAISVKGAELILTSQEIDSNHYLIGPVTIYKSTDNGSSMTNKFILPFCFVNEIKNIDNVFYIATTGQGLYSSIDNGENWAPINTGFTTVYSIEKHKGEFFIATDSGVYKNLIQPGSVNNNITVGTGYYFAKTDSSIVFVSNAESYYGTSINVSNDDGETWNCKTVGEQNTYFNIAGFNNSYFISSNKVDSNYTDYYLSDFAGNNWNLKSNFQQATYINRTNGSRIISSNGYNIYYSIDSTQSWTDISVHDPDFCNLVDFILTDSDFYCSGWCSGELYQSSDSGNTWSFFRNGMLSYEQSLSLHEFDGILFSCGSYNNYRRLPSDNKWKIMGGLPEGIPITDFASDDKNIYACSTGKVYYSPDYGDTWKGISDGLPMMCVCSDYGVGSLMEKDGYLYYGTERLGVWRVSTSHLPFDIIIPENPNFVPDSGVIIYPNPASDLIYISGNILSDEFPEIDVFNLQGQLVITCYCDYSVDVSMLVPSLYIVRVITSNNKSYFGKFVKH